MRITRSHVVAALAAAVFPALASAQVSLENLQIHGYLTQGYVDASQRAAAGIPTDPTGDYRVAALQFRYAATDNDAVIVQLRHRRIGTSPIMAGESDVTLNWAFYQHNFGGTKVKVGRLPAPKGIFSEIRSVGTLLPFYRAPYNFYAEGFETVDGASIARSFSYKSWSLDGSAFGGGWAVRIPYTLPNGTTTVIDARLERTYGGQVWLNTPIQGLRVGVNGMRYRSRKATDTSTTPESSSWGASLDGDFSRFTLRSEYSNTSLSSNGHLLAYYGQAGVKVTSKLSINAQDDIGDQNARTGTAPRVFWRNVRDFAVGANYQLNPQLALKLEKHDLKGYNFDKPIAISGAPQKGKYVIASVAASF